MPSGQFPQGSYNTSCPAQYGNVAYRNCIREVSYTLDIVEGVYMPHTVTLNYFYSSESINYSDTQPTWRNTTQTYSNTQTMVSINWSQTMVDTCVSPFNSEPYEYANGQRVCFYNATQQK